MRPRLLTLLCLLLLLHSLQIGAKELQVVFDPTKDLFVKQNSGKFLLNKDGISILASKNTSFSIDKQYYRWYQSQTWSFSSSSYIKKIEFIKEGTTGSNTNDFNGLALLDSKQPGAITFKNKDKNYYATWEYTYGANAVSFKNTDNVVWFTKIIVTVEEPLVIDGESETASNSSGIKELDGFKEQHVALQRKFVADGGWYTLCLPFYRTINQAKWAFGDDVEIYWFTGAKHNEDGTVKLIFTPYSDTYPIVSGKPCLIKPSKNTGDETVFSYVNIHDDASLTVEHDGVRFVGTYDPIAFPTNDGNTYAFLYGNDGLSLAVDDGNDGKLKGTRAYFVLPNGAFAVGSVELGETDDVEVTKLGNDNAHADETYFTLTGLRLQGKPACPGVYIHAGHKIVIR